MREASFCLGATILAAGRSVRMGRPKMLLPWGETSILGHLIKQWELAEASPVMVVHAAYDQTVLAELDRLAFPAQQRVENPKPDRGMFSSVLCAAESIARFPILTHYAFVLGDQPHLQIETLVNLIEFARQHPDQVCQPIRENKYRHPVVLPRSAIVALSRSKAANLKEFLLAYEVAGFPCNDPGFGLDIDRPEDYEKALALAGLATRKRG